MGSNSNPTAKQLKDTISAVLDSKGVLSKIRAHLRASVLTSVENPEKLYGENESAKRIHASADARAMVDLIREFLEFYQMDFTLSVFLHEANIAKASYDGRSGLSRQYNMNAASSNSLLVDVITQKKPLAAPSAGAIAPSSANSSPAAPPSSSSQQPEKKEPVVQPPPTNKKISSLADLPGLPGNKSAPELTRKEPLKPLGAKDSKPPAAIPTPTPTPAKVTQPPVAAQPKKVEPPPVKKTEPPKPEPAPLTSLRGLPSPLGKSIMDDDEEDVSWKEKEKSLFNNNDDDDDIEEDFEVEEEQYDDDFEEDHAESDATEDRSADDIDVSGYEFSELIRK